MTIPPELQPKMPTPPGIRRTSFPPCLSDIARVFMSMAISAILAAIPAWAAAAAEDHWGEAKTLEPIVHDVGPVFPGTVVAYEFPLINDSTQAWDILDSRTSCTCILKKALPPTIAPGERAAFGLSFYASDATGDENARGWVLKRIAGATTSCPFVVQCHVCDYLDLPRTIMRIDSGKPALLTLKRAGHPDRWTRVEVDAGASADRFVASLVPRPADTWDLTVTATTGKHRGDFKGRLTFTFFDGDRALDHRQKFDVSARLAGSLVASPSSVLIGGVLLGQTRDMCVVLRPQADHPLPAIASVECLDPDRMQATLTPTVAPHGEEVRLNLRFHAVGATGKASSGVILHLDNGELFHIPYLAAIAETPPLVPGSSATP